MSNRQTVTILVNLVILVFACLTTLACGGGSGTKTFETPGSTANEDLTGTDGGSALPALASLDSLRGLNTIFDGDIDVTDPILKRYTYVHDGLIELNSHEDSPAFALYRVDMGDNSPLAIDGTGGEYLWLGVANYGLGRWEWFGFAEGSISVDLSVFNDLVSPEGYLYTIVVCEEGQSSVLTSLAYSFDDNLTWNNGITTDEDSITITWDEMDFDAYNVYRSTVEHDPYPFLVGTVTEQHNGGNSFTETVQEDGTGRWVPMNNDAGTPGDPQDDFPEVAPAVTYFYSLRGNAEGSLSLPSTELTGMIPWGSRRLTRRELPDTTNQSMFIGRNIHPELLTAEQIQWCADHLAGCIGMTQDEVDTMRTLNPDFLSFGAALTYTRGDEIHSSVNYYRLIPNDFDTSIYPLVYGNTFDTNGWWSYIDNHEDWFIHWPCNGDPNERITVSWGDYPVYALDLDSQWSTYLSTNTHEVLGEDHQDGYVFQGMDTVFGFSEFFWEYPDPININATTYMGPRFTAHLTRANQLASSHELDPYVIADVYDWFNGDTYPDDYPVDLTPADIVLTSSCPTDYPAHSYYTTKCLVEAQNRGLASIFQNDASYRSNVFNAYCVYLLTRGAHSYFYLYEYSYLLHADAYYTPIWAPIMSWDPGAPVDPYPESIEDLEVDIYNKHLQRNFENGIVALSIDGSVMGIEVEAGWEYTYPHYQSNHQLVGTDGTIDETIEWHPIEYSGIGEFAEDAVIIRYPE